MTSKHLQFRLGESLYKLNYTSGEGSTWQDLTAQIEHAVDEPLAPLELFYVDDFGSTLTVRSMSAFEEDILHASRPFVVKKRVLKATESTPIVSGVPQQTHLARFPNKNPASRPIPPVGNNTLIEIKKWAYDLMDRVSLPNIKRARMEDLKVFYQTRALLSYSLITTDEEYEQVKAGPKAKFYFTFETTVQEEPSTEDLVPDLPDQSVEQFVRILMSQSGSQVLDVSEAPNGSFEQLASVIRTVLEKGDIIIVDEIQAHPALTRLLMRALAREVARHNNPLSIRRLILLGTPPSLFLKDAIYFKEDEWNKIDVRVELDALNPTGFMEAIETMVGYLPAREILMLWTLTGGVPRQLQSLLLALNSTFEAMRKKVASASRDFGVLQYNAIKKWITIRCDEVFGSLSTSEWEIVKAVGRKQSVGLEIQRSSTIQSLRTKGIVSELALDLSCESSNCLTLNNEYTRSLVRAEMFKKSTPLTLIQELSGFGLEDLVAKVIDERHRIFEMETDQSRSFIVEGLDLARFTPISLAYDKLDIDLVLVDPPPPFDPQTEVQLILGSYKLKRASLAGRHAAAFCNKNVDAFLRNKVPKHVSVTKCTIVGLAVDNILPTDQPSWGYALATLKTNWPATAFEARVWSLSQLLDPLRKATSTTLPYPSFDQGHFFDKWPFVDRQDFRESVVAALDNGQSLLVRGFAGVGKTTYTAKVVADWVAEQEKPPRVYEVDGFMLKSP
ncbi:hypothetical protein HDU87_001677 [Geranomyces variabilis]|uniref:Uncharacterized protein n=1 Tax=Geranomyces variabilis TaxID=109894 RepID=A0AAD5TB10_9FUNG|nr:hypothetical protein HDU87_001677 [Geranomyces variabilis]